MKLSIFTTITRPLERGDLYPEALECFNELADEVVVIDGEATWPKEFEWQTIGEHFQKGYEQCTGDWVIHADLDFIFHERDFEAIRQAMEDNPNAPALSFWKYQFILPDRYNLKSRLVIAVNKGKYGNRIRFDSGGDLCQPSLDGQQIMIQNVPEARVPFYNYEKILKSKYQIMDDVGRMERAYVRHFGKTQYGSDLTNEDGYRKWYQVQQGKLAKPHKLIPLSSHPKYMQETIQNLTPEQFGYNGFGMINGRTYA